VTLLLLKLAHVLSVIFWIGGVGAMVAVDRESATTIFKKIASPALLVALVAGAAQVILAWPAYAHAHWMHAKMTVGLIAIGLTHAQAARLRRDAPGRALAWATVVSAALVVALVVLRPF
jgi:uncharacterized membrane protein